MMRDAHAQPSVESGKLPAHVDWGNRMVRQVRGRCRGGAHLLPDGRCGKCQSLGGEVTVSVGMQ